MTFAKLLGLTVTVAAALTMVGGTASATVVTSNGSAYTGNLHIQSENGHFSLHGANGVTIQCSLTTSGAIQTHGSAATATAPITTSFYTNCTNALSLHVGSNGSLVMHSLGGGNATLTSTGTEVTFTVGTIFGTLACGYTTNETHIGTLTGSSTTGGNATIDYSGTMPRTKGSALCGATGLLTGSAKVTTPAQLTVD